MSKNGLMLQAFEWYLPKEPALWKKVEVLAPQLAEMGITALWLPPAYKDANGDNGVGYAAYDLYDLGEFDQKGSVATKYGTKDEYLAAIRACHKAGIEVYADMVFNHKIGADEIEEVAAVECNDQNRQQVISDQETIKAWTKFTFPGRKGKYSDFVWDAGCFDGTDWDDGKKKNAIYLFNGKNWESGVDAERVNYDYLMGADLDFDEPRVKEELTKYGKFYLDTTGVDGFRLDAVKHIKSEFYRDWVPAMREHSGKNNFVVGEYWSTELTALQKYLAEVNGCMSLFDVPLHLHLFAASQNHNYDLRTIFDGTLTKEMPMQSVSFVDNHDTQPGQALQSFVEPWFKQHAYALLLFAANGYPCVFWGDLYGIEHDNISPVKDLPLMCRLRAEKAYGQQEDYLCYPNTIGFVRKGDLEHPDSGMAVIMANQVSQPIWMSMGSAFAGATMVDALKNSGKEVVLDENGSGEFVCLPNSVSVYIKK